jgi:hypothetical protein
MDSRPATALGLVVGVVVGAGAVWIAGDVTIAIAAGAVYAVAVGVAARWEPVARERGLWEAADGRYGPTAAAGVVALALLVALLGVHPALDLGNDITLVLRLLIVGSVFAGLYVGVAVVLLGVEGDASLDTDSGRDDGDDEPETDAGPGTEVAPD